MSALAAFERPLSVAGRAAGVVAIVGVVVADVGFVMSVGADGSSTPTPSHAPWMAMIRAGFVLIALAASHQAMASSSSSRWRLTIIGASVMLAISLFIDTLTIVDVGAIAALDARLGALDDVERRLFRLAAMASRAVPMIALMAAASDVGATTTTTTTATTTTTTTTATTTWAKASALLLRLEPTLFAIGATTLPLILAASGLVHRELAWALPIGADTTLLGCVAAAIRLRRRGASSGSRGFGVIAASMGAGLIMGTWSFGGPLPTPPILGDYVAVARTLLRDAHIVSLVAGVVAVATSLQRRRL